MTLEPLHFTWEICIALFVSLTALAADTRIDATRSALTAVFTQEGVPVEVPFRRFSGAVVYNPANVAASSATLEVETGSLDIGDEVYNAEVRRRGWFDSARFAKATFRSTAIKPGAAADRFTATGVLTIKGRSQAVTAPITVRHLSNAIAFEGTLAISRKAFGIGDPIWEEVLADEVRVRFYLVVPAARESS